MTEQFLATIRKHDMIQTGDNVMACVSGGADSMALLSLLLRYRETLGIRHLSACHFNHGLRGDESDGDERLVRDYCARHGVSLAVGQGNMLKRPTPKGESTESYARTLRYAFFEECAGDSRVKIAVAHNKNDVAESILFNLSRGTGIKGARGMPPVRGNIIRPLYDIGREEIERFCEKEDIVYAVDSTNASLGYARNRVRHKVLPQMELVHAGALGNIARFGRQADALWRYMERTALDVLREAKNGAKYETRAISARDPVLVEYAMKLLLEQRGAGVQESTLVSAMGLLTGECRKVQINKETYLCAEGGYLYFDKPETEAPSPGACVRLSEGRTTIDGFGAVVVTAYKKPCPETFKENSKNILNNSIDCDKITGNVVLRGRKPGDRFCSHSRGVSKTLKKLYNEMGLRQKERDAWPVLSDDAGILWVCGQGVCRRAAVTADTKTLWHIEAVQEEGNRA